MKISKHDVQDVSLSVGFGFTDNRAVRNWMQSKGFTGYADYVAAYVGKPRDAILREIEIHATA